MNEPKIDINGVHLTEAQAATIRVALENFSFDLEDGSLGTDEHGKAMTRSYKDRIREIRYAMRLVAISSTNTGSTPG